MTSISRRRLLQTSGLFAAATALGACNTSPSGGGGKGAKGVLHWWDHSPNLQAANKKTWAKFEKMPGGMPVEYQYHQTSKLGQALQLAKQSNQLPDIHTNVGLNLPLPALIKEGWYQPIELTDESLARVKDSLIEGVHIYDGKIYSFPIAATKQYWAANWFNKEMLEKAGLDPANPPKTYDEFRAACLTIKKKIGGSTYAWIMNLGFPGRVAEQVTYLAQAAGSTATISGIDFKTGQHIFHTDPYVNAIEFLLSLQKDKLMVPGSGNMNDKVARARWATGAAAFYFDGPWCAGIINKDLKQFKDKHDVGPMLVPEAGKQVTAYRPPQGGMFWLSGQAKQVEAANLLLSLCNTEEYFTEVANGMPQPPPNPEAVAKSDAYPSYKKLVEWFNQDAFIAPIPQVRNPDVAKAQAEEKGVKPGLGELVQGMFSGDVKDVRTALKQLSDKSAKERDRAIAEATKKGAKVTVNDWAFPDWQPRTDYGPDKYKK